MRNSDILKDESNVKLMAILNYTPDSFYDGGKYYSEDKFLERSEQCVKEGADILDIGVASTRPGAKLIEPEKEWEILKPLLLQVRKQFPDVLISIDTYNSFTAEKSIEFGADIINDISGGQFDSRMFEVVSRSKIYYVLMHTSDIPERMQQRTNYTDVVNDVKAFLKQRVRVLEEKGFSNIIVDPGFGFGKTIEQNFELLNRLDEMKEIEKPLLVGLSRKSMIYKTLSTTPNDNSVLLGTVALNTIAVSKGSSILRVHDVKENKVIKDLFRDLNCFN
ncbi:MAG: dihydropteroate synthase [Bacteroidia bacterium]|nr:MAG: dihydropteroate synthase [Bacteroidia bacterium]